VIYRAFFYFLLHNHIINIYKKTSFSGEVKDSVIFPLFFYFIKELNPPASGRGFAFAKQGNYCLPPAGVLHSQNKVINAPPTASHKGGTKVWADGWAEGEARGGGCGFSSLMK
jgi:hypothetical protein